jgi:simple sugar transport system substrate-binding protein/ribose transport system substrate-binding protein
MLFKYKTRKLAKTLALAAGLVLVASGCGAVTNSTTAGGSEDGSFKLAGYIQERIDQGETLVIKLSYHDPSLAFAKPIREGMERAGAELGVNVQLIGPSGGDAAKQVAELQTLITQKSIDGIAVSSASSDALMPVIAQAYNAGIPIISFNTNNPDSQQMGFVGQDLKGSGKSQAEELVATLSEKGVIAGNVVVFSLDTGAGWSNERFSGFEEGMAGSPFTLIGPVNTGNEPSAAYNIVESTMTGQADVVGIAGLDCCSTTAAATWISQSGNTGKIVMAGFDLLPQTAEFVENGTVNFTISQNPGEQGYQAVKILFDFLKNGKEVVGVDTGAQFITKENLSEATVEG